MSMSDGGNTRVLNMRINNKEFLKGTADSLKAVDTLNKGIENAGKGKGIVGMGKGVDTVKAKFSALQVAGVTALATIVHKAVDAGLRMVKALTISPVLEGFREYEKILTSTQTIMANTGKSAAVAGKYLDELNDYADKTVYNFGQMADNIGKFTAAGVKLPAATAAIKGLANSAALAGSDTNQLNTAMYQMSQALASGTIKLMDWNSLVNAGMGGKNMQLALKESAMSIDGMGAKMQEAIKAGGSFRDSLRSGWLNADVFSKAMKVMAGTTNEAGETVAYTVKQLQDMGYSKEAAIELNRISQAAIDSATKIKTFSQLMDVVKESLISGWAGIFKLIFGDLDESIAMWTAVGDVVTGAIGRMFHAAEGILEVWHNMEDAQSGMNGFQMFWGAIGNIFKSIGNLLRPFVVLLGAMVPNADNGGKALFNLTKAFYTFTVWLEKVTSGTSYLTPVMEAIASVVGFVVRSFWDLIQLVLPLGGAIFDLIGTLADLVLKFVEITDLGDKISSAFQGFHELRMAILEPLVHVVEALDSAFRSLLSGDVEGFRNTLASIPGIFAHFYGPLVQRGKELAMNLIDGLSQGFSSGAIQAAVSGFVNDLINFFKSLLGINSPSTVFMEIGRNIIEGLAQGLAEAWPMILDGLASLGKFLLQFVQTVFKGAEVIARGIGSIFDYVSSKIGELDKFDVANIFSVLFGGAVLVTIRSFMKSLRGAADAITGLVSPFGELTNTMKTLQMGIKAKALLNIALAIGVLAISLWILSKIPHDRLVTGMLAITFMMYQLIGVMKVMAANAATTKTAIASITAMAFAFVLMSSAILLLSAAVLAFGNMDTGTLIKGMTAVAVALGILAGAAYVLGLASGTMILAAGGILILSVALAALAPVILLYSKLDWNTLFSGLLKMAAALVILGLAMIPLSAQGPMILVAAAALVVLSVGLASLLGVILMFENVSWGTLIGGVAKIAAAILILGLASIIAAPGLIALGVAAVLLGAGFLAIGLGLALAGAGIALIAAAGTAAVAVIIAGLEAFLALLPLMAIQFVAFIRTLITSLAEAAPEIVDGLVTIITEFLRGISELAPVVAQTAMDVINAFLTSLTENSDKIFEAAFKLINDFATHLEENMPQLVETGIDIVRKLIEGIGNGATELVGALGTTVLQFMQAIHTAVDENMPAIVEEGVAIAGSILEGIVKGLVPEDVRTAIGDVADGLIEGFKNWLGINSPSTVFAGLGGDVVRGLAKGIRDKITAAIDAARELKDRVVKNVKELPGRVREALGNLKGILKERFNSAFQTAKDAVRDKINDIINAIKELPGKIRARINSIKEAAKSLGKSIVDGIGNGVKSAGSWAANLGGQLKGVVNKGLGLPRTLSFHKTILGQRVGGSIRIPGFARGTDYFGGGMAMVGEAGPELVSMGRGSSVITNKNLKEFMKTVNKLARFLTSRPTGPEKISGGKISYTVDAAFRGDPKRSGVAFAANIAAGLINGLKDNQSAVNKTMVGMGIGMAESFQDILGIRSPSTVFKKYASYVAQGFIDGLIASADAVQAAATAMGQAAIRGIAKTVTDSQIQLESLRAKMQAYSDAAEELKKKAEKTKSTKEKARLEKEATALEKKAEALKETVEKQEKLVERENTAAERAEQYAAADTAAKADMRREDAIIAAAEASEARERALRLQREADLIRKYDKARAAVITTEAQAALAESKTLAADAEKYAKEAYELAQQVQFEIDAAEARQLQSVTDLDVANAQAAFDAYTKLLADAEAEAAGERPSQDVTFVQNNTSPEAISPAEAYRHGKSLVSLAEQKLAPTGS